jgi:dTDP-4-amino-4,6-dideoxygalactose transaminase
MFVVNPDPFLQPTYRISPFQTEYVAFNNTLPKDYFAADYFDNRFGKDNWIYSYNGREAIYLALQNYELQPSDLVTILTTSENFYISSCVTKTIEIFCRWNREIVPETKIIFVNHEFGYPHPNIEKIVATGLPVIEDCCTTFFSQDKNGKIGRYGDFSVFSFPKFFPIQFGGLLVKNTNIQLSSSQQLDEAMLSYIQNVMAYQLKREGDELDKRRENFNYAISQFSDLGFSMRFSTPEGIVPSVLLLNNNGIIPDLNIFKVFLNRQGIQNSVFYGEDAFFLPIHQNMKYADIDYFIEVVKFFIAQNLK